MKTETTLDEFLEYEVVQDYLETVHNFSDVDEFEATQNALRRFLSTISSPLLRRLTREVEEKHPDERTPTWELLQWMEDVIQAGSEDDRLADTLPATVVMG
ncbi:MAG: hypothetical protein KBD47_02500 [Candidatus Pacebacteria bacterium]|jgi:hypothetical protein|nr:hypothetical protein [Candidatus Paceibacterota bacterium]